MCARIADARDPQRRNLTSVIVYGDQMVSTSPVKYPTFVTHNSTKICADIHFSQKRKLTFTPTSCQNCNFSCIVVFDSPINPNCTLYLKGQCAAFMGIYWQKCFIMFMNSQVHSVLLGHYQERNRDCESHHQMTPIKVINHKRANIGKGWDKIQGAQCCFNPASYWAWCSFEAISCHVCSWVYECGLVFGGCDEALLSRHPSDFPHVHVAHPQRHCTQSKQFYSTAAVNKRRVRELRDVVEMSSEIQKFFAFHAAFCGDSPAAPRMRQLQCSQEHDPAPPCGPRPHPSPGVSSPHMRHLKKPCSETKSRHADMIVTSEYTIYNDI